MYKIKSAIDLMGVDEKLLQLPLIESTNGDDLPADTTTTGVLEVGGTVFTDFEFFGDEDWFAISVEDGQRIIFSAETSGFELGFTLYDQDGNEIAHVDGLEDFDNPGSPIVIYFDYEFETGGTYFVGISGDETFGVLASLSATEDDYSSDVDTTGVILLDGNRQFVSTDQPGDSDWLAFDGLAGQTVQFNFVVGDSGLAQIRDSSGAVVTGGVTGTGFNGITTLQITLDSDGEYFLDLTNPEPGGFILSGYDRADDFAGDATTTGIAVPGQTISGVFHGDGTSTPDQDWFSFTLEAGQTIEFFTEEPTYFNHNPLIFIPELGFPIGIDGTLNVVSGNYQFTFTAEEAGEYYFIAQNSGIGFGYSFDVTTYFDDFADSTPSFQAENDIASLGVLTEGQDVAGILEHNFDLDFFTLDVVAGDIVSVTLNVDNWETTFNGNPAAFAMDLMIYDADENLIIAEGTFDGERTVSFTATESGTYFVGVGDLSLGDGLYTLSTNIESDDFPNVPDDSNVLPVGEIVFGESESLGDVDVFALTIESGDVIRLDGITDGTTFGFVTEFTDINGTPLEPNLTTFNATTQLFRFDEAGTYYLSIAVDSVNPSQTGLYAFIANEIPDYAIPDAVVPIFPDDVAVWAPLPELATTPDVAQADTLLIGNETVTVAAGDVRYMSQTTNQGLDPLARIDDGGVLINNGTLWIEDYQTPIFALEGSADSLFVNNGDLTILSVQSSEVLQEGFFQNYGTIRAVSYSEFSRGFLSVVDGEAYDTFDQGQQFLNAGSLEVWSGLRDAEGVVLDGFELEFVNSGTINVTGFLESIGVNNDGGIIQNSGTISAISGTRESIGVFSDTGTLVVNNSGTISADIAIGSITEAVVTNTGSIFGDVILIDDEVNASFDDNNQPIGEQSLTNSGFIFGNVILGNFEDVYDGVGGYVDGIIFLGAGNDIATGGDLADFIEGGLGNDVLDGGDGLDVAVYASGLITDFSIVENADGTTTVTHSVFGTDELTNFEFILLGDELYQIALPTTELTESGDTYSGTDLGENILALGGNDTIFALGGDDIVDGGSGRDTLNGGDGNDVLEGGGGADVLNGGDGIDTASYEGSTNQIIINLANGSISSGHANGDTLVSIENITGTRFADTITGNNRDNLIIGGEGFDVLSGFRGDDHIIGGEGHDFMIGGAGADIIDGGAGEGDFARYVGSDAGVTIDLAAGTAFGGHAEGDVLIGIERLFGSSHDDNLTGDGENNWLFGDGGADVLSGGAGIDKFFGGSGADTFIFSAGDEFVFVTDFENNIDTIDLSSYGYASVEAALEDFDQRGDHVRFFNNGETLFILNADLEELADDINIGGNQSSAIKTDVANLDVLLTDTEDQFNFNADSNTEIEASGDFDIGSASAASALGDISASDYSEVLSLLRAEFAESFATLAYEIDTHPEEALPDPAMENMDLWFSGI